MNLETREKFIKTVIWIIVIAFVTTIFATWGAHYSAQQKNDPIAIIVDGSEITKTEYFKEYESRMEKLRKSYDSDVPDTAILELRNNVADNLIKRTILKRLAEKYSVTASPNDIQNGVLRNFWDEKTGLDKQKFEYFKVNYPVRWWQAIEQEAAEENVMNKAYMLFSDKVKVTEQEIKEYFLAISVKAKIHHIFLPTLEFVADADAEKYYNDNRDSLFIKPEKRLVRHIIISDTSVGQDTPGSISLVKINNIYDQLKNGQAFEELVRHSDEPYYFKSKTEIFKNGELGYLTKEDIDEDNNITEKFIETVFALKEGEIAEPFRTTKGWEIAQVTDIKDTEFYTFKDKQKEIKRKLVSDTDVKKNFDLANTVYNEIIENKISFEQAIMKYSKSEARDTDKGILILPRLELKIDSSKADTAINFIKQIPVEFTEQALYISGDFSDTIFKQNINEVGKPTKSKIGYHIIKITELIAPTNKEFKSEYVSTLSMLIRMKSRSIIDEWFKVEKEKLELKKKIEYRFSEPDFLTKISKNERDND